MPQDMKKDSEDARTKFTKGIEEYKKKMVWAFSTTFVSGVEDYDVDAPIRMTNSCFLYSQALSNAR